MNPRDAVYLRHILGAVQRIQTYAGEQWLSPQSFRRRIGTELSTRRVDGILSAHINQRGLGSRLCARRARLVREIHTDGPSYLVVEVLSNRTAVRDAMHMFRRARADAARIESAAVNRYA